MILNLSIIFSMEERQLEGDKKLQLDEKNKIEDLSNNLNDLSKKIESLSITANSASKRSTTFPVFTFLMLFSILITVIFWGNNFFQKPEKGNSDIVENVIYEIEKKYSFQNSIPLSDSLAQIFKNRLTQLEDKHDIILSASKQSLSNLRLVFATVASFFGLFTLFFGYRQILMESRKSESQAKHEQEMRGLVSSFQDNINNINSLISTLEQSYSYRKEVYEELKQFKEGLIDLKGKAEKEKNKINEQIDELNYSSFELLKELDRNNFKQEEKKKKIEIFSETFTPFEKNPNAENKFNPFTYYLKALHLFNQSYYIEACTLFKQSEEFAIKEINKLDFGKYPKSEKQSIQSLLSILLNDCNYHLGIMEYNQGNYSQAQDYFLRSFDRDKNDYRSRIYIPEIKFFDTKYNFKEIQKEFEIISTLLQSEPDVQKTSNTWKSHWASLKIREGNIYLKKLIPLDFRTKYRVYEDSKKAANCYWEAYQNSSSPFMGFSLAQAILNSDESYLFGNRTSNELFSETFSKINRKIATLNEPILLFQNYYILAICTQFSDVGGSPIFHLANARAYLRLIPKNIKIFSPINKILLTKEETLEELERFEKHLQH